MQNFTLPERLAVEPVRGDAIEQRFKITRNEFGPECVYRIHNPQDDRTWGYVVVDNLVRGRGLGGLRLAPHIGVDEVYGLASAMTMKSAMHQENGARNPLAIYLSMIFIMHLLPA